MSILVTGANGFVGRALVSDLSRRGYVVRGAVRDGVRGDDLLCSEIVRISEVGPETSWASCLAGVETVVHLAARVHIMRDDAYNSLAAFRAVNVVGTKRLARAAAALGVKRFILVSSIGVNGNRTESEPFTEKSATKPYNPYTLSKFEAERALLDVSEETGMEIVIVRPPLVYGPGNPGNFLRLLRLVDRRLPLPLASIDNRRSMVYVGNLVDALAACITNDQAKGNIFLVNDGEDISTIQLIQRLSEAMEKRSRLFPMPESVLKMLGLLTGKSAEVSRLVDSLVVDGAKIRTELGWKTPYSLDEGLRATVDWYRQYRSTNQ